MRDESTAGKAMDFARELSDSAHDWRAVAASQAAEIAELSRENAHLRAASPAPDGAAGAASERDLQTIRYALHLTMRHTAAHDAAFAALDRLAASPPSAAPSEDRDE